MAACTRPDLHTRSAPQSPISAIKSRINQQPKHHQPEYHDGPIWKGHQWQARTLILIHNGVPACIIRDLARNTTRPASTMSAWVNECFHLNREDCSPGTRRV